MIRSVYNLRVCKYKFWKYIIIQVWVGLVWVECFLNFDNTHSLWTINLKFLTTSHDDFLHIKSILELYPDEETNRVDNISE
jgi:hypothetical protein